MGDYEKSQRYYRQAYKRFLLLKGNFSKDNAGICLEKIGKSYLCLAGTLNKKDKNYYKKLKCAEDTLMLAVQFLKPNDWKSLTETYQDLYTVYDLLSNYKKEFEAYKQYSIYDDSLDYNEIEKKVVVQEMEYDYTRRKDSMTRANMLQSTQLKVLMQQQELDKLRSKQQRIYIILAFVFICLITAYFLYRNYLANKNLQAELADEKMAKQLQAAEHEKNISRTTLTALIAQMNPHFLFNALNTIQSFIYSNDKKNASGYLGKFSELTRKILDNSGKKNISLNEEITLLQLYLDIEKVRFGDSFEVSIQIDQHLDMEGIFFPPMLVQPYAENAIKNGLLHKKGKKELKISIHKINDLDGIEIIIDDNGIGREKSYELNRYNKVGHQSFANTANLKRIELINQTLDKKIKLNIIDKKDANGLAAGTTVVIIIPT